MYEYIIFMCAINYYTMADLTRKKFISNVGLAGVSLTLLNGCDFMFSVRDNTTQVNGVHIDAVHNGEDIFAYINRVNGTFDQILYRQLVGAANEFKEGDKTLGIAATDDETRNYARELIGNTELRDLQQHSLYNDDIYQLIGDTTAQDDKVRGMTMNELKSFVLAEPENAVKKIMPALSSDIIACLVKLMDNDELVQVGQKVFNPLPGSNIGARGYMSARVQPNSPTDNIEDISWQVFNAWSYAVGDLVLGTNPVSSQPESVAAIERQLYDIITTFGLEQTIPNCVLSHIDIQAQVEELHPGTTGIWFQSLAGTVNANKTFDVTIDKMFGYADQRDGRYGLYAETGQGADFTNGHGEGFDMVVHESRKYGFLRALKQKMAASKNTENTPWVHVNDVAGFIGPEIFKTKEQLVRCCLEDIAMGKLHGLPIGLDICSTLHMDVTLDDLDWCIDQIMPANPAYLMALPTKNDPMLSYLTTAFNDHVRVREKFGYKVNDAMWDFFRRIEIIDDNGNPTAHFGDPVWVYYQYRLQKYDKRSKADIYAEGRQKIKEITGRGVPIAKGHGKNIWDLQPQLDKQVRVLYEDAKESLWTEMPENFVSSIPAAIPIVTRSADRKDYVYHPESGEEFNKKAEEKLKQLSEQRISDIPDVQIVISDGLNARALMDEGHLVPYLEQLRAALKENGYKVADEHIVIRHGRVRAGYRCGELLFGNGIDTSAYKGIVHIIGERPGSGHHNFSAYLTATTQKLWGKRGTVDHNISKVVSGISDTALKPAKAVEETISVFNTLFRVAV